MAKKLQTPCSAPKRGLPCEFKLDYAMGGYLSLFKGWLYVVREEFGAETALRLYEKIMKMDDRVKKLTNNLLKIFKIEGNDCETIGQWWDVYAENTGTETTILERSKTIERRKITKCPFKTEPKDLSDWSLSYQNIVTETINPKATLEKPKMMCAGDPYCEYVWKIEE